MSKRFKAEVRKESIVGVALRLAGESHYTLVQRNKIAAELGVTPPAITHHFGTMPQLQKAVIQAAIKSEDLVVLAQGLVARDELTKKVPEALRRRALLHCFED